MILRSNFSSFPQYFVTCCCKDFHVKKRTRYSHEDKRLFEISQVEIMRIDCILEGVCETGIVILSCMTFSHFKNLKIVYSRHVKSYSVAYEETQSNSL